MAYISSVERIGLEKGMLKVLGKMASKRFQVGSDAVQPIFAGLSASQIEELADRFEDAESLDDLRQWADELRNQQR